ncbi:MAG: hypothetical protein ACLROU_07330 [Lachnospiraceae bacterium]
MTATGFLTLKKRKEE